MAIALDCPHCKTAKVQTANQVWYLYGFLIFASYGSKTILGCSPCVRSKTIGSLTTSSLFGWWCFPWGLGTPIVIGQNLLALAGNDDDNELRILMRERDLDFDDLVLDADGLCAGDRRLMDTFTQPLHQVAWATGKTDDRELDVGAENLHVMLGEARLSLARARGILAASTPPPAGDLDTLSPNAQVQLMQAACAIAAAVPVVDPAKLVALKHLARRMGFSDSMTANFLGPLEASSAPSAADDVDLKEIAAATLGIEVTASSDEIRRAFEQLVVEATTQTAPGDLPERMAQLHGAYDILLPG